MKIDNLPPVPKRPKDGLYTEYVKKTIDNFINSVPKAAKQFNEFAIKIYGDKNGN